MKRKRVFLCGPRCSGKREVKERLFADQTLGLRRILSYTSRPRRPGEVDLRDYLFLPVERLQLLKTAGQTVCDAVIQGYPYVLTRLELLDGEAPGLAEILPQSARLLRPIIEEAGGQVLTIFLHAPEAQRRGRALKRDPQLLATQVNQFLAADLIDPDPDSYPDFDMRVENLDGQLGQTVRLISDAIHKFVFN